MATGYRNSGYKDNWQTGKTVTECNLHMLTKEDCSDVIFRVGSDKHEVRAHRYVLISRSCVFHAMFCGSLAEKGEVTIPDIEPHIFEEFLKYIYTDTSNITTENVTGLLYTSRKYAVDVLFNQCSTFLENSLSEKNACQILEQCHDYGELDLEQKALKILTEAGKNVIRSSGFQDLCTNCIGKFLKSDDLKLQEEEIFEATLSWMKRRCKKETLHFTHKNIKRLLGEMRYEIRFGTMTLDYLAKVVGPSKFLTNVERIRIMDSILRHESNMSPFKSSKRFPSYGSQVLPHRVVLRFYQASYLANFSTKFHVISFSISKSIDLLGCQIYGPEKDSVEQYGIRMTLTNSDECVIQESFSRMTLKGDRSHNDVLFPNPVLLEAGSTYSLSVKVPIIATWCGMGGEKSVQVDGVVFSFTDSPTSSNTGVAHGQIPGLLFRPNSVSSTCFKSLRSEIVYLVSDGIANALSNTL